MTNKKDKALKGKDLINVGIYTALYCMIMTAIAMLGYIPILMPMLCGLGPLICGVPAMLYYTKIKKFGMITLMGILIGAYLWLTGMGYWPFIFGVVFGPIADLIAKSGGYRSFKKSALSYAVLSLIIFGNFVPLYTDPVGYFSTRQEFSADYAQTLTGIMQTWTIPVLIVACFVFGYLGAYFGHAMLKKHFKRAGIA